MVLLNFADQAATIQVPFPKQGIWREMLDDDIRPTAYTIPVPGDNAMETVVLPSHYGYVFVLQADAPAS